MSGKQNPARVQNGAATTTSDVVDFLSAMIADAERCADDVHRLLLAWQRDLPAWADRPLTREDFFLLGALVTLRRWEQSGLLPRSGPPLPNSDDVLRVLVQPSTARAPIDGEGLAKRLSAIRLLRLAWEPLTGRADVVLGGDRSDGAAEDDSEAVIDAMAELLWQFRHLAASPRHDGKEH
jgi:hypothetical protein